MTKRKVKKTGKKERKLTLEEMNAIRAYVGVFPISPEIYKKFGRRALYYGIPVTKSKPLVDYKKLV